MRDLRGTGVMGMVMVFTAQPMMTAAAPIARPVALDLSPDGSTLFIVHHDADMLVAVSTQTGNVTAQVPAGVAPSDVAVVSALDEVWTIGRYESVLRRFDASSLTELASIDVPPYCERIAVHPGGTKVFVTNSFENSLLVLDTASLQVAAHIDLDGGIFPRDLLVDVVMDRVYVAEFFSESVAVVDLTTESVIAHIAIGALPGGLALSGDKVIVCHLDHASTADTDIQNTVSLFDRSSLSVANGNAFLMGNCATPKAAVFDSSSGSAWIACFGSDAVVDLDLQDGSVRGSVPVGPNPIDLIQHPDGRIFGLNHLGDSLTVINNGSVIATWSLNASYPGLTTPQLRGERVFNQATGTGPNTCYNCHPDGHLDGLSRFIAPPNYLSSIINTPSLRFVQWTPPFRRNAGVPTLGLQDADVLEIMLGVPPTEQELTDLVAYMESLGPEPNPFAKFPGELNPLELQGQQLFDQQSCASCHPSQLYTNGLPYEVGTGGVADTPTLLGLWNSAPYLNDGRAAKLADVFQSENVGTEHVLADQDERQAMAAYLLTLRYPSIFWSIPRRLLADGSAEAVVRIQVFDVSTGRPVQAANIQIELVDGPAGIVIDNPASTNSLGATSGVIRAAEPGTATFQLLLNGEVATAERTLDLFPPGASFVNVAEQAGVAFEVPLRAYPRAVAIGDYDGDGLADIFVAVSGKDFFGKQAGARNYLLRNNGDGTFVDETVAAGLYREDRSSAGAAWGDYDNDGDLDLFIANRAALTSPVGASISELYRNNGDGTFTEVGESAGVADVGFGYSVFWFDFDHDGLLDLYAQNKTCTGKCGNEGNNTRDALYQNNGDGTFSDVTDAVGIGTPVPGDGDTAEGGGDGGVVGDYNNDGFQDVIKISKDDPPRYYQLRNEGGVSFTTHFDVPGLDNLLDGTGAAFADYDNDADLDLFVVGRGLFRNDGNGNFEDVTPNIGFSFDPYSVCGNRRFGHTFVDLNNDGWVDIVAENRATDTCATPGKPAVFLNQQGTGQFQVVEDIDVIIDGASDPKVGLGAIDYDNDGDMDFFLCVEGPSGQQQQALFENRLQNDNRFIRITLEGTDPLTPRSANGARLFIESEGLSQMREIRAGENAAGCADYMQHIGLAQATKVDRLTIHWPSGNEDVLLDIPANQHIRIREGDGVFTTVPGQTWFDLAISAQVSGGQSPLEVAFASTVLHPQGDVVFLWDLADGSLGAGPSPTHVFEISEDACAEYLITATARDKDDQIAEASLVVVVVPQLGDFDGNHVIDLTDNTQFVACFTGPGGGPVDCDCAPGDYDGDRDVDCDDWTAFDSAWPGPDNPPVPAACGGPPPIPAVSTWGMAVTLLTFLSCGSVIFRGRQRRPRLRS